MEKKFEKTISLIGENNFNYIKNKNILICGLGGVGGYVAEMIARLNVSNIYLVDYDTVDLSNFNRQIIATNNNIGKFKTECFKSRINLIDENIKVFTFNDKIDDQFFKKYDFSNINFIFDCIDDTNAKINIYKFAKNYNIDFISSMGTARKTNFNFEICDIEKTSYCPLAKKMRELCKINNLKNIKVIYNKYQENTTNIGTLPTIPSICGIMMVQYMINLYLQK